MKNSLLFVIIIGLLSCNLDNKVKDISSDYLMIRAIISHNSQYFQNKDSEIPRIFYTSSLNNEDTQKRVENHTKLLTLLKAHDIDKVYISSSKEIWYVISTKERFFKTRENLIGFANYDNSRDLKIKYFEIRDFKKIKDDWFSLILVRPVLD